MGSQILRYRGKRVLPLVGMGDQVSVDFIVGFEGERCLLPDATPPQVGCILLFTTDPMTGVHHIIVEPNSTEGEVPLYLSLGDPDNSLEGYIPWDLLDDFNNEEGGDHFTISS